MIWKWICCQCVAAFFFYLTFEYQNQLTSVRLEIPETEKKLAHLIEENRRLTFESDRFESPSHLLELARHPHYSHLKFPTKDEVVIIPSEQKPYH